MSVKYAILGLLTIQPMTGYELKHEAFDKSIAHFWQTDQAQIYRTLALMEDEGWVESSIEVQLDRPNKRIYQITALGRESLLQWLHSPQPPPVYREPFLVQMFFAGMLPQDTVLQHIQQHLSAHRQLLEQYRLIESVLPQDNIPERDQLFWRMTLDIGIAIEKAYLDWLTNCQRIVESMP